MISSFTLHAMSYTNCYIYSASAARAMAKAPSYVSLPPMKPEAWQKTPPGMPETFDRSASRTPRQASGSDLRLMNESDDSGTHWMRHLESALSGDSG